MQVCHVKGWDNERVPLASEKTEVFGLENICSGSAGRSEKCEFIL